MAAKLNGFNQLLFCPGPVNVAKNVRQAVVDYEIGHREEEFSDLLQNIQSKLMRLYQIRHASQYHAVIITGSGTAANEAILSSVVGEKHILVLSNGEFGERLFAISSLHNKHTKQLRFDWGEKIDEAGVEKYLRKNRVDIVAMVHHETSTGMINPVAKIGALTKKYKKLFIVDTVSSAGAEDIKMQDWNIGFCSSSASKAIASLPGAAFVVGKIKEFEKLENYTPKTTYLDLYKFYKFSHEQNQTPNTPAVSTFFALDQALTNLMNEGVVNRHKKLKKRAKYLRDKMLDLGLTFLLDEDDMSTVLTTVKVPPGIDLEKLRQLLHKKNIIIYNGKGPLAGKVFQVGNIGDLNKKDVIYFLKGLKEVLSQLHAGFTRTTSIGCSTRTPAYV